VRHDIADFAPAGVIVFGATLLLSAFLMFGLEPFVGRLVLPLLGGSPAVWNTCLLFFQGVLLAGYAWAHLGHRLGGEQHRTVLHVGLVFASLLLLPVRLTTRPIDPYHPIPWLLQTLAVSVGVPFFVLASTTSLIQRWFSRSTHRGARDPYFLYAASNLGSLGGLLAYPALVERLLPLRAQAIGWSAGYALLALLTAVCALASWRAGATPELSSSADLGAADEAPAAPHPRWVERLRWLLLAAAPSSLLLGLTTYLTTDIAAIPLLWVVPLAIYLLTFICTFVQPPVVPREFVVRWQPMLAVSLIIFLFWGNIFAATALLPFHLLAFFATALLCHGALAATRPSNTRLTEYYLWIAAGGVLGGLFNVLVAPIAFDSVLEYPLVLALACGIGAASGRPRGTWRDLGIPLLACLLLLGARHLLSNLSDRATDSSLLVQVVAALASCVVAVACYRQRERPLVFSAALTILVLAGYAVEHASPGVLLLDRDFYGVRKVGLDSTGQVHILYNGSTKHGAQNLSPRLRTEPLSYYARSGPLGDVFAKLPGASRVNVGVVGLGTGAMAAYARPGERWTFYELDPEIERIARDPRYFTYLTDSPAQLRVVLGDGRLSLRREADGSFDLLVLDAFSSDAIPVHLLTREALGLYLSKLAPGGVLLCHLSNRYLDLGPVLASLTRDAGLVAWSRYSAGSRSDLADPSEWLVAARRPSDVGSLGRDHRWRALAPSGARVWTDEYSNVLAAMKIFRR
jgi:SAM-dependent methyltransferase